MRSGSISFSVVPLLLVEENIPAEARRALVENRRQDAAKVLMRQYALSCIEAGNLLNVTACEDNNADNNAESI